MKSRALSPSPKPPPHTVILPFRQTTVQARLAILLSAMLLAGLLTASVWYYVNRQQVRRLRDDYRIEKQEFVRQIVDLKSARLHGFIVENTYWDQAVSFLNTSDSRWARENLDDPGKAAGAGAIWVFQRDGSLLHSWQAPHLTSPPPSVESLRPVFYKLGHSRILHWFTVVGSQVWEMHGATINSGKDPLHQGAYYGFMVAGRPCNVDYVYDISVVARCHLRVPVATGKSTSSPARSQQTESPENMAVVSLSVPLTSLDGKIVATMLGTADNPLAPAIEQATREAITIFLVFSATIIILTVVILTRWLNAPIRLLTDALVQRDPEMLSPLLLEHTEFGVLAQFIADFFRQETVLLSSQEELEGRVADRTAELAHRAYHDALTGLANRAKFSEKLDAALARTRESGMSLAVLFVDLDDFKIVNDSLGHDVGDGLLCAAARRMQDSMPRGAVIARFGGDEFAILLEGTTDWKTRADAEKLAAVLQNPFLIAGHTLTTTASIGVASGGEDDSPGDVLRNADIAMYDAKAQVRSRDRSYYSIFDSQMLQKAEDRLEMEAALRSAMRDGGSEFHLVYQPIYDIKSEHLAGMEALLRWHHPTRGPIPPRHFIPLAEETGLIHEMTEWVLREACACHIALQNALPTVSRPAFVSVNFSAVVLQSEGLASHILKYLRSQGLSPSHLAIEVTESVIARQSATVLSVLGELRAAGVRVLMDDFGTGYSSMASLMDLPVDILKIDRAFVGYLEQKPATRAILRAIIELAAALQMGVICEGIERREQRDILAKMGCHFGQGYLFSHPLPRTELEKHLTSVHPMTALPAAPGRAIIEPEPPDIGFSTGLVRTKFGTRSSRGK